MFDRKQPAPSPHVNNNNNIPGHSQKINESPKEDETLVDIIEDIKETKDPVVVVKKPIQSNQMQPKQAPAPHNNYKVFQNPSRYNPPPLQQYQRLPNQPNNPPQHYRQPQGRGYPQQNPNVISRSLNSANSQKMINQSISRHCQIYKLDKKKPIFFSCHQCKNKTKSYIKQE
jgi:hypothetical protein